MRRSLRVGGLRAVLVVVGVFLAVAGSAFALTASHHGVAKEHAVARVDVRHARIHRQARPSAHIQFRTGHARIGHTFVTVVRHANSGSCKSAKLTNRRAVYCKYPTATIGKAVFSGAGASLAVSCAGKGTCVLRVTESAKEKLVGGNLVAESARAGKKHHKRHHKTKKKQHHKKPKTRYVTKTATSKIKVAAGHSGAITVRLTTLERLLLHKLGSFKVKLVVTPKLNTHGNGVQEVLLFKK